jgi:hypothetical protein
MKTTRYVLLTLLGFALLGFASGQDKSIRVGEIEFYGFEGLDVGHILSVIPVHVGGEFSPKDRSEIKKQIDQAVFGALGNPPTDVAIVCCDAGSSWIIYVGLPGKSSEIITYNPEPSGSVLLPAGGLDLYRASDDAVMHAVENGTAGEDDSKGYALAIDPALRAIQLQMRDYATHNEPLLRDVLQFSPREDDREAAAEILGYANRSDGQIASLVHASYDSVDAVRNNAVRALGVLAMSSPKIAGRIPASGFIAMLNSGVWTDRNKSGFIVMALTKSRNPELLAELRARALPSLIEMARWDSGHAYSARIILGRVAGIDEARLEKLAEAGDVDAIVAAISK